MIKFHAIVKLVNIYSFAFACVSFALVSSVHAQAAKDKSGYEWTQIAPGAYAHYGLIEDFARSNHGDISNAGLIIGDKCAAVIDTGGSPVVGKAQRLAIAQVTDKPICFVINTHVHPDHMMGNVAYAKGESQGAKEIEFVGNTKLVAAMGSRGQIYLNSMNRELGEEAAGAQIIAPSIKVDAEQVLDLGNRKLSLKAWPTAHTDHDLTVYDETSQTLWTGDLLFITHTPVVDGSVKGWLAVLKELQKWPAKKVVPGHGRADKPWPQMTQAQAQYLLDIESKVRAAIGKGRSLPQTITEVGNISAEMGAQWQLLESFHRRNITAVYAELEWE
jgi:quinoprotein relay system zinc metallohydrolase 2